MARWKIAQAKQNLSQVIRRAEQEPQEILNRERLVAAVIGRRSFQEFEEWQRSQRGSLAKAFDELRQICAEESYRLKVGSRGNRRHQFRLASSSR